MYLLESRKFKEAVDLLDASCHNLAAEELPGDGHTDVTRNNSILFLKTGFYY